MHFSCEHSHLGAKKWTNSCCKLLVFLQLDRNTKKKWFPLILENTGGKKNEIHSFIWMVKIQTLFARFVIMSTVCLVLWFYRVVEVQLSANVFLQGIPNGYVLYECYLLENYYLSPVLAILLLQPFRTIKTTDLIQNADDINQLLAYF